MAKIAEKRIGIIGAGVMGQALIKGMLKASLVQPDHIFASVNTVVSREKVAAEIPVPVRVGYSKQWTAQTDVFLICTKPNKVAGILKDLVNSGQLKPTALIVSIAAGVSIAKMESALNQNPVIRAMPNTPCLIGAGVTVLSPGAHTSTEDMAMANEIFSSVGQCHQLAENHLNAVTAVSGSGPAYTYLIMEALADGAVKVGLPRNMAFKLVSQTMLGAAQMLQNSGKHPATLKDEVTTPSGCTIAALLTMEDGRIRSVLARAVEEATRIAGELG